jgi:pimeloyl-ACP methyl ester carboxylesterase
LPTLTVNGVTLFYVEQGEGDPVVLVHGGLGDYRDWGDLLPRCAAEYRGIAYSRRNAQPNPILPATVSCAVADHASDLIALLTSLHAEPAHLVADSYGATVALLAALRSPGLVRTLILDEPPVPAILGPSPGDRAAVQELTAIIEDGILRNFDAGRPEEAVRALINYIEGDATWEAFPADLRRQVLGNATALERELRGGFPDVSRAELGALEIPVLLLRGDVGPEVLHRCTDALAASIPGSRLVTLPGLSHGALPQSEAYREEVLRFLRER